MKIDRNSLRQNNGKFRLKTPRPVGKNNRLGRGLDALLGPANKGLHPNLLLDIEKIQPNKKQPRTAFDKKSIEKLSASIKANGVLQPILVQKKGESYQIIAGERRWRAAGLAGLRKIPAIIREPKPEQKALWALIENMQREDLNPIETAKAFKKIMDENHFSQEVLAKKLGLARPSLTNSLRLLQLDQEVQQLVEDKKISFAQARELLRFKSPKEQREMARRAIKKSLTVKNLSSKAAKKHSEKHLPFWAKKALSHLEKRFSQKLNLNYSKGKGRLTFSFRSEAELKNLLNQLWK